MSVSEGKPGVVHAAVAFVEKYWLLFMVAITGACSVQLFHWEAHDKVSSMAVIMA